MCSQSSLWLRTDGCWSYGQVGWAVDDRSTAADLLRGTCCRQPVSHSVFPFLKNTFSVMSNIYLVNDSCWMLPLYHYWVMLTSKASRVLINPLMGTLKPQSNGPLYSNMVISTLAVDGWAVTFGFWYSEEGRGRAAAPPSPLLAVPNVTAHPPTASVPTSFIRCGTIITSARERVKGVLLVLQHPGPHLWGCPQFVGSGEKCLYAACEILQKCCSRNNTLVKC